MDSAFVPRTIVNGSVLPRSTGKLVSILVKPTKIDSSGRKFTAETTDGISIQINLQDPLNSPLDDWIEVIGMVASSTSVNCSEIIVYEKNEQDTKEFHKKGHNMLVNFLANVSDFDLVPE